MQKLHPATVEVFSPSTMNSGVGVRNGTIYPTKYPNLTIETIHGCNAKCKFCGYQNSTRAKGVMPMDTFHKVIDEVATWSCKVEIVPIMWGEFFLNPDYRYILEYLDAHLPGCTTAIPTNASLVDDKKINALVHHKNLTYLGISLYTMNPDRYTDLMGLPPETIGKAAHLFNRIRAERPDVIINIGTTNDVQYVSAEDQAELSYVIGRFESSHEITKNRAIYEFHQDPPHTVPCIGMFSRLFVLKDGSVSICCFDPNCELEVGNVNESTVLDIWNGGRMRRYQKMHNDGLRASIELCASCTHEL